MNRLAFLAAISGLVSLLGGCSGIVYNEAYDAKQKVDLNPSSPPTGGFAFSLRTSTVLISAGTAPSAPAAGIDSTKTATSSSTKVDCTSSNTLTKDCTAGLIGVATPVSDTSVVYFASPMSTYHFFGGTTLAPKTDASDPMMLQSVTFTYKNQTANIITGAGAGAVAGLAFGPAGAWIGGFLGAASAAQSMTSSPTWASAAVCASELGETARAYQTGVPPKVIWLPVALDYPLEDESPAHCWHTLPLAKGSGVPATGNVGWFYRIVPSDVAQAHTSPVPPTLAQRTIDSVAPPFQVTSAYFKAAGASAQQTFPVSACRAVIVELAWWEDLQQATSPEVKNIADVGQLQLTVADSRVVQVLKVNGGSETITLLPCGGYVSAGQASSALADDISALVKQAQQIKSAEKKPASSTTKSPAT